MEEVLDFVTASQPNFDIQSTRAQLRAILNVYVCLDNAGDTFGLAELEIDCHVFFVPHAAAAELSRNGNTHLW